jgi:hypothetical protein
VYIIYINNIKKEKVMEQNSNLSPDSSIVVEEKEQASKAHESESKKGFLIILSFLFLLLVTLLVVYFVFKKQEIENPVSQNVQEIEETEDVIQEKLVPDQVVIYVGEGRDLVISGLPLFPSDSEIGYQLVSEGGGIKIWEDNSEGVASTSDVLEYYENEEAFFGSEPLESVTVDGETYVYHTKVHGEENDGTGIGSVINMGLTTDINGYEAYELIYYYNPAPEREDLSSPGDFYGLERYEGGMKVFCLFELKQIDESLDGFILLKCINASSSYNVCKTLGSEFSIIVRDFAI